MTNGVGRPSGPAAAAARLARRWWSDLRGATLVQFVAVLPIFVLIVIGMWGLYTVYSAQQTLCEAVWEASRYLQVEGPQFPRDDPAFAYPDGWEEIARTIINEELASNRMTQLGPLTDEDAVTITPLPQRREEKEMKEVTRDNVTQDWFFVHAKTTITNPLGLWTNSAKGGGLTLQCKGTGFFESPPIGPTAGAGAGPRRPPNCPAKPPVCTLGPPPTSCPACTPTPVPECPPCRPR